MGQEQNNIKKTDVVLNWRPIAFDPAKTPDQFVEGVNRTALVALGFPLQILNGIFDNTSEL